MKRLIAGIDSGNSKTAFLCVAEDGQLVARGIAGPSNYQTLGRDGCLGRLRAVIQPHLSKTGVDGAVFAGWGFGLAGLDRDRDRQVLDAITSDLIQGLFPGAMPPRILLNDAFLSLRVGAADGVGVAVSSGTSGNCVGMNQDGRRVQIGGIASELGDGGGGFDIAIAGLKAAGRARDGRAPKTLISDLFMQAMGISDIADVVDFMIPGNAAPDLPNSAGVPPTDIEQPVPPLIGLLAPLVFQAASMGDIVARNILETLGRDMGVAARVAAFRLGFLSDQEFPLVLGGSVLQKATEPTYRNAIVGEVSCMFENVRPVTIEDHPVAGAVLLGFDAAGIEVTDSLRVAVSAAAAGM